MFSGICGVRRSGLNCILAAALLASSSCSQKVKAKESPSSSLPEVGVVRVVKKTLQRTLVVSSELVPFQQIDVYAKESGFVRKLNVDYGTHVKAGQTMAVLEIPELQVQLDEDQARDQRRSQGGGSRTERDGARGSATEGHPSAIHPAGSGAKDRPGLVAQQEVDDWQGKDLAAQAQVAAGRAALDSAQSQLIRAQARERHDQVIFDYSKITAPFTGVVTQRYANLGTLMQSGTNSSTQALPLVQLSQDDLFRLVIPVPESYVADIRVGDPVDVRVPSLNRHFPGRVARFSVDVEADTRTMHTEVDVPNPKRRAAAGRVCRSHADAGSKGSGHRSPAGSRQYRRRTANRLGSRSLGQGAISTVTLGVETPDDVEVVSGLKQGELVAVGDRSRLKAGETVRPKEIQLIQISRSG